MRHKNMPRLTPDQLLRLAIDFEQSIPKTLRTPEIAGYVPEAPITIDVEHVQPLDEFEKDCLRVAIAFSEVSIASEKIVSLLKTFDANQIYTSNGVAGKLNHLKLQLKRAEKAFQNMK